MDEPAEKDTEPKKSPYHIDENAWRFGFYQSNPYPSEPSEHWPAAGFRAFILPERVLSLKLFFDNFRNYGICAAFAAFGIFVLQNRAKLAGHEYLPSWFATFSAAGALSIAALLLVFNILQSGMLFVALCDAYHKAKASKLHIMRGHTPIQAFLMFSMTIYSILEAVALTIITIALPIAMLAVLLGFVWYGATAKTL